MSYYYSRIIAFRIKTKMIDISFLDQLRRFSLIVRKRVTSNYTGGRQSQSKGRGLVLKDHREYVEGDDIRDIDWRVFARTDKLHIKTYEEERNLTVHIIVDFSGSMNYGEKIKKCDYASMVGIGFAYMALRNNERFLISTFADDFSFIKPRKGQGQLASLVDHLEKLKPKGKSNLKQTLLKYRKKIDSRSLIIIVSDFLYDVEELKQGLMALKGSDVKVVQVLDSSEKRLQVDGNVVLKDLESETKLRTFVSARLRKNYTLKLNDHISSLKKVCDELGVEFASVDTSMDIFDVFYCLMG